MKTCRISLRLLFTLALMNSSLWSVAQDSKTLSSASTPLAASAATAVPSLVPYSGLAIAADGKPLAGETGITFQIFKDEAGGEALWTESQTVAIDSTGHYKVQLGATSPIGLPAGLFSTGEARWLEVQIAGEPAQPRVLLASVPYALKAGDATTLGGLPASAFALAGAKAASAGVGAQGVTPDSVSNVTTTGGTTGYLPEFSGASTIVDSPVFVSGSNVGIGTATPAQTLDVNGTTVFRSNVYVYHNGTATPNGGVNSVPMVFLTEGYNSSTKAVVAPAFQWKAEVVGNNTASPSATQNLIYTNGVTTEETGFYFNPNGTINFAPGQTFPGTGTGNGTITGVTAGAALTGGGSSGAVTLNVDTTKVPLLAASNTFTGNQTINGNLGVSGTASAGIVNAVNGFELGGSLFAFGSRAQSNAYLGFAGNNSTTGIQNTAVGVDALAVNTTGNNNTASGELALWSNRTGGANTANGDSALAGNTSGDDNTAIGFSALGENETGSENTASGFLSLAFNTTGLLNTANGGQALFDNTTGSHNTASGGAALALNTTGSNNVGLGATSGQIGDGSPGTGSNNTVVGANTEFATGTISNATALGANAEVTESNTMVLGCIKGTNGCTNSVSVGIGTTAPDSLLTVNGTADKPGGGSWGTYSDIRLKTLNGSFGGGLNQVMQLHPIRYRYKPDNALGIRDSEEHIGVVAQEVQKVIPDAVTENGKGYLLVNNDPILWSMVNAIQEQQKEIAEQQKLIREQSRAMKSLVAQVRETRKALRQVKAQAAADLTTMVAAK